MTSMQQYDNMEDKLAAEIRILESEESPTRDRIRQLREARRKLYEARLDRTIIIV